MNDDFEFQDVNIDTGPAPTCVNPQYLNEYEAVDADLGPILNLPHNMRRRRISRAARRRRTLKNKTSKLSRKINRKHK